MRNLLPLLAVLPLLVACGRGFSDSNADGGTHHPTGDDGGISDDDGPDGGACADTPPGFGCAEPCGGGYTEPQCVDGAWQCPVYGGVDCIEDAGVDACSEELPLPACVGVTLCAGESMQETCYGGVWSCDVVGECDGGMPGDQWAPPPFDADPPLFSCGTLACDPSTSYCEIATGGPVTDDGGTYFSCNPLPTFPQTCSPATCACVMGYALPGACSCVAENGNVIVTCDEP